MTDVWITTAPRPEPDPRSAPTTRQADRPASRQRVHGIEHEVGERLAQALRRSVYDEAALDLDVQADRPALCLSGVTPAP